MKKLIILCLLLIFPTGLVFSQTAQNDYSLNPDSILSIYSNAMHSNKDYLIGREYKTYHFKKEGSPLLNGKLSTGTVYSKGRVFRNLLLAYDLYIDELIVNTSCNSAFTANIKLQKVKIDSFTINFKNKIYHFKNLNLINNKVIPIQNGFYEIIYEGKIQILYKHIAALKKNDGLTIYEPKIIKYLKIDDSYYNINSKQKFLKLFSNKKILLKKRIATYNSSYKKISYSNMVDLIMYTESF